MVAQCDECLLPLNCMLKSGKDGEGINWKIRIDTYMLLHIKKVTNKELLYSTGNSTQYSVMAYMGKEFNIK